jgi:hypothetical protein
MSESSKKFIIDRLMPKGKTTLSVDAVEILMGLAIDEAEKETRRSVKEAEREDKYGCDL